MILRVSDLEKGPLDFNLDIESGAIDYGSMVRQIGGLVVEGRADLVQEHRGPREILKDIRLRAGYHGQFEMLCARCLEPVHQQVSGNLDLIYRPEGADAGVPERAISTSDADIGYYQEGELELDDVLREQVLLSLPAKVLCREECKGLCPSCGQNLNVAACACGANSTDPRWAALGALRGRMKL